ncbi:hypothetical protein D9757_014299 [Collybiopsis confluens]|uniref:F-box domain-containing protein n=1 Tax=Collybiopsis confluens TaxID=2823264 RepID=A0A8H5FS26_9AGAR|nr:hypothetical protein D9757_014299 [Collybiopsis confluens]
MPWPTQSGIYRLPDEIFSYIFLSAIRDYDHPSEAAFFPLAISHTCSRWRKVSLSTASLWTSIKLCLPLSSEQLEYLDTWLERSKAHPLDMLLDFRDEDWAWEEENHILTLDWTHLIFSAILPHAKRWRHIELFTDTWAPIHTFLDLTRDLADLPFLKSVALSRCNAYFARKGECFKPIELREPIPLFGGAQQLPSLRELSLVGVHVDWQRSSSSLVNLSELEFKFHAYDVMPSLDRFREILAACPELERLSIVGWGPRIDEEVSPTGVNGIISTGHSVTRMITLPKLTRFCFGFVDVEYAMKLLSFFILPFLSELELEDVAGTVDPMGPSDSSPLLNFFVEAPTTTTPHHHHPFGSLERINLSDVDSELLSALGPYKFFSEPAAAAATATAVASDDTGNGVAAVPPATSRRPSFVSSLSTTLAPCPQLVDVICRRVDTSILSSVISARSKAGSGVKTVQLELAPDVDVDDGGGGGDDDGDFDSDDGKSAISGLSEEDRCSFVESGVELIVTT